jgi:DNA repair exonuclease SbcCD ATPase subunit
MRLERLKLKNFCQHRELDWTFPSGIIAITGPNGSGKSNSIKAAYAALTGDFKRNEGVVIDNINKLCLEKDESSIELTFSTSGNVSTIVRSLRPNKRSLVINGGTPITADKDISAAIEGLIGVNSNILSEYIFVDQWQMFEVFTASKSERMSALQSLYGLGRAEVCYDEISKTISKINIPTPSESVEDLDLQIREKRLVLNDFKKSMSSITPEAIDISSLNEQLKSVRQLKSDKSKIIELKDSLSKVTTILKNLATSSESFNVEGILCGFKSADDVSQAIKLQEEYIAAWGSIDDLAKRIDHCQNEIDTLKAKIKLLGPVPSRPLIYYATKGADLELFNSMLGLLSSQISCLKELTGKNECPVCKTSGPVLENATKTLKDSIAKLTPVVDKMREDYTLSREYDTSLANHSEKTSKLTSYMSVHKDSLDALKDSWFRKTKERPKTDLDDCMAERSRLHDIRRNYEAALIKQAEDIALLGFYRGQADSMTEQISKLEASCPEANSLDDYSRVESDLLASIATRNNNRETFIRIEEGIKSYTESIDYLENRRKRISLDLDEARINIDIRNHLETLREVMHKSNLPRKVAVNYLKQTVSKMNNYLEDFHAPFRVYSDDELTFWAKFNDNRSLPASRLSGGEKVLLSLAFRLAVQFGVASSVNLLVLDEPTVGLDDDNIECLETAFNRLRAMSVSSGLQVLVVSHEKAMERMCDHTLSLYR